MASNVAEQNKDKVEFEPEETVTLVDTYHVMFVIIPVIYWGAPKMHKIKAFHSESLWGQVSTTLNNAAYYNLWVWEQAACLSVPIACDIKPLMLLACGLHQNLT